MRTIHNVKNLKALIDSMQLQAGLHVFCVSENNFNNILLVKP